MTDPEAPVRVAHLVDPSTRHLTVPAGSEGPHAPLVGFASVLGVYLVLVMVGWMAHHNGALAELGLSLESISALAALVGCGVGIVSYQWVANQGTQVRFSSSGIEILEWTGSTTVSRPSALLLRGHPGGTMRLATSTEILVTLPVNLDSDVGWDYRSATWLGQRAAALLDVPLVDERDEAKWLRWSSDPDYRAATAFDHRIDRNHASYRSLADEQPEAPDHDIDHEGLRVVLATGIRRTVEIRITNTQLVCGDLRIALAEIDRVGLLFETVQSGNGDVYFGSLKVLVQGTESTLVRLPVPGSASRNVGALRWLEDTLRGLAACAPTLDRGSADEIPAALARQLQGRRDLE